MKRLFRLLIILLVILLLAAVLWWFFGRGNPNALWQIVSQQCVPNQQQNNDPAPCLKVDLTEGYVLFKDSKGPYHDLVMPTEKVSGIESPALQTEHAPPYFAQAWNNREHISGELGKPLKDAWLSPIRNMAALRISCIFTLPACVRMSITRWGSRRNN